MTYNKVLSEGVHIVALSLEEAMDISSLFPEKISGSSIEKLTDNGTWSKKQIVLYEDNHLMVNHKKMILEPFSTIRLDLKRPIAICWNIKFFSNSGIKPINMNFEEGFDIREALNMANLASLAYRDEKSIKSVLQHHYYKFTNIEYGSEQDSFINLKTKKLLMPFFKLFKKYIKRVDLQFFLAQTIDTNTGKKLLIIIFKGTQENVDWTTNLARKAVRFSNVGYVHEGFKKTSEVFFKRIKNYKIADDFRSTRLSNNLKTLNDDYKILIGGHSLGGAIATLTGCYLYNLGIAKENMEIYTFGAPPVGTKAFCQYYENKVNVYRIVNKNDVIPMLDKVMNFSHIGKKIVLESNNIEAHSCASYVDNLLNY